MRPPTTPLSAVVTAANALSIRGAPAAAHNSIADADAAVLKKRMHVRVGTARQ